MEWTHAKGSPSLWAASVHGVSVDGAIACDQWPRDNPAWFAIITPCRLHIFQPDGAHTLLGPYRADLLQVSFSSHEEIVLCKGDPVCKNNSFGQTIVISRNISCPFCLMINCWLYNKLYIDVHMYIHKEFIPYPMPHVPGPAPGPIRSNGVEPPSGPHGTGTAPHGADNADGPGPLCGCPPPTSEADSNK